MCSDLGRQQECGADSQQSADQDSVLLEVVEAEESDGQSIRRKGIFLLPNLFTTAALFAGFYAIIAAMQGHIEKAALAIFFAMGLDGLDGRVARLTQTQSAFGAEYDSLSDLIAFGLAPALLAYSFSLSHFGKVGWMFAFVYTACAALRLARFNVQAEASDKRFFIGLSSTCSAGWIASVIWLMVDRDFEGYMADFLILVCLIACSVLMVINLPYRSFKQIDLRGRVPFVVMLVFVLVLGLVSIDPPLMLTLIGFAYGLSGPIERLYSRFSQC